MNMNLVYGLLFLGGCFAVLTAILGVRAQRLNAELEQLRKRYASIIDVDAAADNARVALQEAQAERDALKSSYQAAKAMYDRLSAEVGVLEGDIEDMSFGLYRPHFDFDASEKYKSQLTLVYEQKKAMVKAGTAALCPQKWSVGGSVKEGERMVKNQIKLMLRAFNGESDSAVAKVDWSNVKKMEERLKKAFNAINEMGTVNNTQITKGYFDLALSELRLTHEYQVKKQEEREEQRHIREQMREEERAKKEFEKAQQEAAAEENRYQRALEKARAEVEKASGERAAQAQAKVEELERLLTEAQEKMQRAVSMAQLTKSGHVYVISNIGSFGEEVYKIGMTRRLEPLERISELGSASVPFAFDVHALIYSEDAPGLENAFHRHFSDRRVNRVNMRKEYFRISLAEIEMFAKQHKADIEFTQLAEAREYRETMALLQATVSELTGNVVSPAQEAFPEDVFAGTPG